MNLLQILKADLHMFALCNFYLFLLTLVLGFEV